MFAPEATSESFWVQAKGTIFSFSLLGRAGQGAAYIGRGAPSEFLWTAKALFALLCLLFLQLIKVSLYMLSFYFVFFYIYIYILFFYDKKICLLYNLVKSNFVVLISASYRKIWELASVFCFIIVIIFIIIILIFRLLVTFILLLSFVIWIWVFA